MQNFESLKKFLLIKNIDSVNVFVLKEEYIIGSLKSSLNHAFVFDGNGILIQYDKEERNKKCLQNVLTFLETYNPFHAYPLDSAKTFQDEWLKWLSFSGNKIYQQPSLGGHLTVVYYWNCFSGNPNHRDFIQAMERIIKKRRELNLKFYKINQDLRSAGNLY